MTSETCQEPVEESDPLRERRLRIERIDRAIVRLVQQRVRLAREVGQLKSKSGLATLDPAREAAVVRRAAAQAREDGISEDGVRQIFWQVIGLCRRAQRGEP